MLKNLKLGTKLNLILLIVFVVIVVVNGLILSTVLQSNAEQEVTNKALLLIETMDSVRDYTRLQVNPELADRLEKEDQFLPQTVPGYSAREVFEYLRKRDDYTDFFYKEATLNPTNLRDKADFPFETKIVEAFRREAESAKKSGNKPNIKPKSGFQSLPSGDLFYVARPIAIKEESCLRCHSTPEAAPKSQIATYGSNNGFNWQLNEIVGAQMISVPAGRVLADAHKLQVLVIGILTVGFLIAVIALNLFLKFAVVSPITEMAAWSREVSTGNLNTDYEHQAKDEIGILAASMNRLKVSMEMAMNMLKQNPPN
jgi:HAMP domain-containing protein